MVELWDAVAAHITATTGRPFTARTIDAVGGGCISSAYRIEDGPSRYFVKLNDATCLSMFEAERDGLAELERAGAIRVPRPIACGNCGSHAFLILEHLDLGSGDQAAAARLGEQLAAQHRVCAEHYGWFRDNTIGSTPQRNTQHDDWVAFWRLCRLDPQLRLAASNGAHRELLDAGNRLLELLPAFFTDYVPRPSLLHGDLWGGNYRVDAAGNPVIFDPAVYYGDREADLAMTELFGGFPAAFYEAYGACWTLDAGYAVRRTLYNLYHVLNHFNLFGAGYAAQAQGMIRRVLAEAR